MKIGTLVLTLMLMAGGLVQSKEITLDYCREQAVAHSPLQKKMLYYKTKSELENESATTNYYPQLTIEGQATYQSDVIELKLPIPNAKLPEIPNEQYKVNFTLKQMIWDGGMTSRRKSIIESENLAKINEVEISLNSVKDMINDLYFRILFLQKSVKVLEINLKQLDTNRYVIESLVRNGVMYRSNLDNINIQLLHLKQKIEEVKSNESTLLKILSEWIEENIDNATALQVPDVQSIEFDEIHRPEYQLFSEREKLLEANKKYISTKLSPKIFAFGLAGYGAPNQFNFFESDGAFYWMAGIKFQWSPFDWSATSKRQESIDVQKSILAAEREQFDKRINIDIIKQREEISKFEKLIEIDNEIIKRQENIVKEYFSRLKNNTITITNYLFQVNSLIKTNIDYELHKLRKIGAEVNLLTKTGNF